MSNFSVSVLMVRVVVVVSLSVDVQSVCSEQQVVTVIGQFVSRFCFLLKERSFFIILRLLSASKCRRIKPECGNHRVGHGSSTLEKANCWLHVSCRVFAQWTCKFLVCCRSCQFTVVPERSLQGVLWFCLSDACRTCGSWCSRVRAGLAPQTALLHDLCAGWLWFCPAELNLNENEAAEQRRQKESGQRG